MTRIPRVPLILGLAGVIPFYWGALTVLSEPVRFWGTATFGGTLTGAFVQVFYGALILSFMSGVLWGFATKATGRRAAVGYAVSVLPVLWVFFTIAGGMGQVAQNVMLGFAALLALDFGFWRAGLTPRWWMALRCLLTALVLLSFVPALMFPEAL